MGFQYHLLSFQVVHVVLVEGSPESEHAGLREVRTVMRLFLIFSLSNLGWQSFHVPGVTSIAGSRFLCFG